MALVLFNITTPESNNDNNGLNSLNNQNISGKRKSEVWDYFAKVE
jgi:hypothetical protein